MINFITSILILILTFFASILHAQITEVRNVDSFNAIRAIGSWNVILEQGDIEEVRLMTENFDLRKVITEVKNNSLHLKMEKGKYKNLNFTVYITFKELESIKYGGSGSIQSKSDLVADKLEISISGSGDGRFQKIRVNNLFVNLTGSGNIDVTGGSVGNLTIKQNGAGNFRALDLQAEEVKVNKSGSGNTSFTANKALFVRSSGSGNVEYRGNPKHSDVQFSGVGIAVKK